MVCKSILHKQMAEKLTVEVNCSEHDEWTNGQMGQRREEEEESVGVLRDTKLFSRVFFIETCMKFFHNPYCFAKVLSNCLHVNNGNAAPMFHIHYNLSSFFHKHSSLNI